jgi:hypothetical protein
MNGSHDHWQPTGSVLLVLLLGVSKLIKHSANEDRIQLPQERLLGSMKTDTFQVAMFQVLSLSVSQLKITTHSLPVACLSSHKRHVSNLK